MKEYIFETTVDQLPILVDIQRYLEELLIMDPPVDPSIGGQGVLIVQVSETFHELLAAEAEGSSSSSSSIKNIAEAFKKLCNTGGEVSQTELLAKLVYNLFC